MQRFRGGLVFQAHRLCVSLNSRLECNNGEEEEEPDAERLVRANAMLAKRNRMLNPTAGAVNVWRIIRARIEGS